MPARAAKQSAPMTMLNNERPDGIGDMATTTEHMPAIRQSFVRTLTKGIRP